MPEVYQSSNAAKNIADVISAMTDAQKSQLDLKKAVMMKQISDKMDLQQKQGEQNIEVQKPIQQLQAWEKFGQGDQQQTQANGLNDANRATNATAGTVGAQPMLPGQPQANPMAPTPMPSKVLTAPTQPNAGAGGQPIVPPSPTQAPMTPVLNSPSAAPGGAPIMPPSVQYNNLGYKPVEAPQLIQTRRQLQQPINHADVAYMGALKNVKADKASDKEVAMVHNMNNRDENGQPIVNQDSQSGLQKGLRKIENDLGYPKGSMTIDLATGNPTPNPYFMKQYDLETAREVQQPKLDQDTALKFNDALDPNRYRAGAFGASKAVFDRGERLESMIDYANKYQQGGADSRQIVELATGFQAQLTGGNARGNYQQVQDLIPHTLVGNVQKMTEWLTNNPQGAKQQAFVDRMMQSVHRENATVQAQMDRTRFQRIAGFEPWMQRNPDQAENIMRSYGVDPQAYQQWKQGGFKQQSAVQDSPEASGVTPTYTE